MTFIQSFRALEPSWVCAAATLLASACYEVPPVEVVPTGDGYALLLVGDATAGFGEELTSEGGTDEVDPPDVEQAPALPVELCIGNNDGAITAAEMPTVMGAVVTYSVNQQTASPEVNVAGTTIDGGHLWDFREAPGSQPVAMTVLDPADFWFSEHFPGADYATPASLWDEDVLGIFSDGDNAALMLGLASVQGPEDPGHTLLVYDEPVAVYRFPLNVGATWQQTATFSNALLQGVKNAGKEDYKFVVDGRGTVLLPQFTLENTLRVRLESTQTFVVSQGSPDIRRVHYFYVHECLGEVARIVSMPGTSVLDFTVASEFRRLGF